MTQTNTFRNFLIIHILDFQTYAFLNMSIVVMHHCEFVIYCFELNDMYISRINIILISNCYCSV